MGHTFGMESIFGAMDEVCIAWMAENGPTGDLQVCCPRDSPVLKYQQRSIPRAGQLLCL